MNVTCPSCTTVYRVDPAKVPEAGVRARCKVCSGVFPVTRAGSPATPATARPPEPPPAMVTAAPPAPPVAPVPPPMAAPEQAPSIAPAPPLAPPAAPPPAPRPTVAPPAVPGGPPRPTAPRQFPPGAPAGPRLMMPPPAVRPTSQSPGPPVAPTRPLQPPSDQSSIPTPPRPSPGLGLSGLPAAATPVRPAPPPAIPSSSRAAPVPGRSVNPFLSQDPAQKARRLARALISDLVVYYPDRRKEGLANGTLKTLFQEEIQKSWEEYTEQVGKELAESTPYFTDALNEILASGQKVF